MGIMSSLLRKNLGAREQSVVQNQQIEIELSSPAANSTMAEAERNNSQPSGIDTNGETKRCRIFKVQDVTRDEDIVRYFKPKILSISPYRGDGSPRLQGMESVESGCERNIRESISEDMYDRHKIMTLARGFYRPENITMGEEDFARMLLLDGGFILAALGVMKGRDLTQLEALSKYDIEHDLLLVENQIPFRVLEEVHNLAAGEGDSTESLKGKIAEFMEGVLQYYPKAIGISEVCSSKDFDHLLHLCHMFFQPSKIPAEQMYHRAQAAPDLQWHRAVQYHEAGVKFSAKDPSTPHSLLDVTFSNGVLEIPRLSIDGQTESLFRSLIMFERGCRHVGKHVNAYVVFMSQLLSNADDVELLDQSRIIEILGHNGEILSIFKRLTGLAILPGGDDYYLESTLQSAEAHYNHRSNRWLAWFKHKHCKNPCLALAALGGFIILLCALIQALFAILQFFIPRG